LFSSCHCCSRLQLRDNSWKHLDLHIAEAAKHIFTSIGYAVNLQRKINSQDSYYCKYKYEIGGSAGSPKGQMDNGDPRNYMLAKNSKANRRSSQLQPTTLKNPRRIGEALNFSRQR